MEEYNQIQSHINELNQQMLSLNKKLSELKKIQELEINKLDAHIKEQTCVSCDESAQVYNCFEYNFMCKNCY